MTETIPTQDALTRWLDREATLRVMAVEATTLCRGLCVLHDLEGDAARDLSLAVAGGLLWASDLKSFQTLSLQIELGIRTLHVDATAEGLARAMVTSRTHVSPIARVSVRRFGTQGILYQSVVDIATADVAGALAGLAKQSDQQDVHVDLVCDIDEHGLPARVRGALVRDFPDTPPGALATLVEAWKRRDGWTAEAPCKDLDQRTWDRLSHQEVHHHCPCSRERALRSIKALGADVLEKAAAASEPMEVVCDFCRSVYTFTAEEFFPLPGA